MEDNREADKAGELGLINSNREIIRDEDIEVIQGQLWNLLGKQSERYTMGDSSSLPIETVQELLSSITYTLRSCLKAKKSPELIKAELSNKPLEQLYKEGQQVLSSELALGRSLLKEVQDTAIAIDNISYEDTIASIGDFFKKYDYRFMAHDIPCDIDYQLAIPMPELYGIEYINEYLTRLLIENRFCSYFDKSSMISLLRGYCQDYKEQLINIFEPVLVNAIGLKLLNIDIKILNISPMDREMLSNLLNSWDSANTRKLLYEAADAILQEMKLSDNYSREYLGKAVEELASRIVSLKGHGLQGVFITFKEEEEEAIEFIDGELMTDEALRSLIDELQQCRYLSDKLAMVKEQVHSLGDFVEILNNCFFDQELLEVFKLFSREELMLLFRYASEQSYCYQWMDILRAYLKL